jgi:isonocardicin synthase
MRGKMFSEDSWKKDRVKINKNILMNEKEYLKSIELENNDKRHGNIWLFERFDYSPQSYFTCKIGNKVILGRKSLSDLVVNKNLPGLFCCKISENMILGEFENFRISEDGIEFFYRIATKSEKKDYFTQLLFDKNIEIHYPAVQLLGKKKLEKVTPDCGWEIDKERAEFLSMGEDVLRDYTILFLKSVIKDQKNGFVVYDPACSTGKFLSTIKTKFPRTFTIGQELSGSMVNYARENGGVDEVYLGDAINPAIAKESADFVFFRFLNAEVVSVKRAKELFLSLAQTVKSSGYAVLFGHTPVLIDADWISSKGFKVIQKHGNTADKQFVFQYMVFQKI